MAKGGKGRVGTLSVALSLNSAAFTAGLKRARSTMRRWSRSLGAAIKRVAKFGAVMGTVAVGAIALFTRQSLKAMDETAKWADRVGIATEALTGLEHAANLTGVTTTQLRTGLQRMTRRISEAAAGTGEARGVLAELNLEVIELNKLSPEKQFFAIAKAMHRLNCEAIRYGKP
jgi:hypothetical protein